MAATLTSDKELTYASFPIEKVEQTEDGNVLVWGKATDASVDSDNQIIDADFAAKAMEEFFGTGPNIRVQHQAQRDPAGVGVSFERQGDAHWLKAKVIEPVAKQLVLGGALRAYSVGIARPTIVRDSVARGGRITDGMFVEISLVDRPANKNCGIQLVKAAADGTAEWVGKVFGSDDVIAKAIGSSVSSEDVTLTFPSDVQMSFSPLDMAKVLARKNGTSMITKDVTTVHAGGVPPGSMPKCDDPDGEEDDEMEKDVNFTHGGGVPSGSVPKSDSGDVEKGRLSAGARNKLPDSAFALPGRRYPIHDKNHARNALARVAQHGTPEEKAKVRAAVARRYPGIGKKKATKAAQNSTDAKVTSALDSIRVALGEAMRAQAADPDNMTDPVDRQVWAHLEDLEAMLNHAARDQAMDVKSVAKKHKTVCMGCGARQNILHKFCTECGKSMDAPVTSVKNHDFRCLGCGTDLDKGEKHCPQCGRENPGYNPMADLKIPANKRLRRAAGEDRVANEPDTGQLEKGKKSRKKGKDKGVLHAADLPDHVFDPGSANKSADLAISTSMRLKNLGIGHDEGYAHDLTCPAFSWEDVSKAYPAGLDNLNADAWQRKALEAASSAPLAQAQAASRLGQAVFTIKAAAQGDLMEVKRDINKAFRDANPGPGSFPTPGHVMAQQFRRPKITAGHAAYARQYDGPNTANVPEGQISASGFERPFMQDGRAMDSPSNKGARNMPVPSPNGVPVNLDYSNIHKEQILQAYTAMHDHFDRVFPGVCPMNAPANAPSPRPLNVKIKKGSDAGLSALTEAVIALPDTIKGEVVNALAGQPATAPPPSLDRKAITEVLRKSQRKSDEKFSALTDAVSILAEQSARPPAAGEPQPAFDRKAVAAVLRKTQKASDKRFLALTEAVTALPGTIREEVANALPGTPEATQPAFDRDAVVAVLSKAQKTSDKRFLTLTKAVNALAVQGQQATDERFAVLTQAVSALPRSVQKDADKKIAALTKAMSALPRNTRKGADRKIAALTEAVNALPAALQGQVPQVVQPELDRKVISGILRKAQKESSEKIMALTEAVSALAEQSVQPAQPGVVKSEFDGKSIAAVLRKAQKASDRKIMALAEDRKSVAAVLRKAQKTSDRKIAALTKAMNSMAAPAVPGEPPRPAEIDGKSIAAVLRKAQRVSDRKIAALTKAMAVPSPAAPVVPGEPVKPGLDRKTVAAVLRKAQKTSDKRFAALTQAVSALADQPSPAGTGLDRKAVSAALRKAQRTSDEKITALTAAVNALADKPSQVYRGVPLGQLPVTPQRIKKPSRPADARVAALRKAQKAHDEQLLALTKAVNVLADQPDPSTQAFKGMGVNPLRTKAARPAGVQSVAEIAERTQAMMLHELEAQWRNSTDPVQREAAWNASLKMRGLLNGNGS